MTVTPRRPYFDREAKGLLESDRDYVFNNLELCVAMLDGEEKSEGTIAKLRAQVARLEAKNIERTRWAKERMAEIVRLRAQVVRLHDTLVAIRAARDTLIDEKESFRPFVRAVRVMCDEIVDHGECNASTAPVYEAFCALPAMRGRAAQPTKDQIADAAIAWRKQVKALAGRAKQEKPTGYIQDMRPLDDAEGELEHLTDRYLAEVVERAGEGE